MQRFTGMRFEDGAIWSDGALRYFIEVSGRGFRRSCSSFVPYGSADSNEVPCYWASGEEFGVVTDVFFGTAHVWMDEQKSNSSFRRRCGKSMTCRTLNFQERTRC